MRKVLGKEMKECETSRRLKRVESYTDKMEEQYKVGKTIDTGKYSFW